MPWLHEAACGGLKSTPYGSKGSGRGYGGRSASEEAAVAPFDGDHEMAMRRIGDTIGRYLMVCDGVVLDASARR